MSDSKIQFIPNHQPALTSGNYVLTVTLENPAATDKSLPTIARSFTVAGERFALKPTDIQAVFPPAGSLGDHSNVLPHIMLNRSTLPWERQAVSNSSEIPWLALLLFDEQEAPKSEVKTLGDLKEAETSGVEDQNLVKEKRPLFPPFEFEVGQDPKDPVTVIDVPRSLLKRILLGGGDIPATADELKYLAHVRCGTDSREFAVIISNRLPKRGGTSIVHLVSLEGRYGPDKMFNYQDAGEDDLIRLISLYSWRFACEDQKQSFRNLLLNLNSSPQTLRLPENSNADAEHYLALGYVPLPHTTRQETKTISWYHGPLLPGKNITGEADLPRLPARDADALMRFNPSLSLLDVSYAAAWELGRFLALQSKAFSTELFNWKRAHTQKLQQAKLKHLPVGSRDSSLEQTPSTVLTWLEHLEHLDGVPFNYLVPDEAMLRPGSIRFFCMDWLWLECLQDGAFSIGRVTEANQEQDATLKHSLDSALEEYPEPDKSVKDRHLSKPSRLITGFLLRSDVVAGWPGLLVTGSYAKSSIPLLRMDRLSKNILICLFDGDLDTIDISLKPETMHFGVSRDDTDPTKFHKDLRTMDKSLSIAKPVDVQVGALRVINIGALATSIKAGNSADFAFQMIEGAEKVQFRLV